MGGSAKYRYQKKVRQIESNPDYDDWERSWRLQDADMVYQEQRQRELERKAKREGTYVPPERKYDTFMKMSAEEKGKFIEESVNKSVYRLPEKLQVGGNSRTQQLVYDLELNDKPIVMSNDTFEKYISDNNLSVDDVLTRSFDNIEAMRDWISDDENYISGRFGGSMMGAGQYFAKKKGENTGYGKHTVKAVFNPETVKSIGMSDLMQQWRSLSQEEQKPFLRKGKKFLDGADLSIYAISQGYNVIMQGKYVNVIDRSALIICDEFF